jgi:hypothetical protein
MKMISNERADSERMQTTPMPLANESQASDYLETPNVWDWREVCILHLSRAI